MQKNFSSSSQSIVGSVGTSSMFSIPSTLQVPTIHTSAIVRNQHASHTASPVDTCAD